MSDFDEDRPVDPSLDDPVPSTDPEAPRDDAVEQATEVTRGQHLEAIPSDPEASEADVLDQHRVVDEDDEVERGG